MNNAVNGKQKAWKLWKNGGTKEEYLKAKKAAKVGVHGTEKFGGGIMRLTMQ